MAETNKNKGETRQVVRYLFFKLDGLWRRQSVDKQIEQKVELAEAIRGFQARLLLRSYSLMGTRGDTDFMFWQAAEDLETLQALETAMFSTRLGAYLSTPYSYLAMTKRSIYDFPDDPLHDQRVTVRPQDSRYLFLYPFVKTRAWYSLPHDERQAMMDQHVIVGRKHPTIRINTAYSFGLDDQEFMVGFEGDDPGEFLDLVMELRESEASAYTLQDTPIFSCIQMSLADVLDSLGGAAMSEYLQTVERDADGFTVVAKLDEVPPGSTRRYPTSMRSPSTLTSYVLIGTLTGPPTGWPVWMLNWPPCQGQLRMHPSPSTNPSLSEARPCVQRSLTA